jgi:hypothetical protein
MLQKSIGTNVNYGSLLKAAKSQLETIVSQV